MVHLLNIFVVIIFAIAYIPQLRTTSKTTSVEGVSTMFWYCVSVSTAISLYNLLLTGSGEWYVYLGQIINAGVAFILFVWINSKKLTSELTLLVVIGHVLLMYIVLAMFPLPLVQLLATIAIVVAYVDQIKHFIKTKNAEGTNPLLYFFFALGLVLLLVIMILTNASFHIMITESANIILLLVCGVLSIKYRKSK